MRLFKEFFNTVNFISFSNGHVVNATKSVTYYAICTLILELASLTLEFLLL